MAKLEVLDFWAEWCGPCRAMSPAIKSLMEQYNVDGSDVEIKKINVDVDPTLPVKYGIRSIPTLVFVLDGVEKTRVTGAIPKEKILEKISESLQTV